MRNKNAKKNLAIYLLIFTVWFGLFWLHNQPWAEAFQGLPVSGQGLGQNCTTSPDNCQNPFFCSADSSTCVQCESNDQCDPGSQTCEQGVCVNNDGNDEGEFCLSDDHCTRDLVCGTNKICQAASGSGDDSGPGGDEDSVGEDSGGAANGDFGELGVDLTIQDVAGIITGLACWLLRVIGFVLVIFIILAGLRFMAAQSNPEKFKNASTNMRNVLIGTLVILGVYVIIATIANAVGITDFSFIPLVC